MSPPLPHPFHSFIVASLGPEQTNTRSVYVGTEASDHARSFGPRVSSIAVFFLTQIFLGDNILGFIFSPSVCVTPALPLSHKEISVADKKLSRGQGPMVITWTRGERGEPARITN